MYKPFDGFAIDTLSYAAGRSLEEAVDGLAAMGVRALQLSLHPGYLWPSELDPAARVSLQKRLSHLDIRVVSVNLPGVEINIASASTEMREYSLDLLRQNIELAADLQAPSIVIAPGRQHPLIPQSKAALTLHFYAALDSLLRHAARSETIICVENAPSAFLPDTESLMEALAAYGDSPVGVCYDTANGHFVREDATTAIQKIGGRLKLLHLADTEQTSHRHAAVGQGSVPFGEIYAALTEIAYSGESVLEIIAADASNHLEASARSLAGLGWSNAQHQ